MAQTYFVTGASRGLGLEFVRQLRARGDVVIAAARKPAEATELAKLGAEIVALDATNQGSIDAMAAGLSGRAIDVLINNAGVSGPDKTIELARLDDMVKVLATNVAGPTAVTRALLPNLRAGRGKKIVMITSGLGSISQAMVGFSMSYCASKSALNMITAQLAKELGKEGFVCLAQHPGWVKTDMGGPQAPLEPRDSIRMMLGIIDGLTPAKNGAYLSPEGNTIPW